VSVLRTGFLDIDREREMREHTVASDGSVLVNELEEKKYMQVVVVRFASIQRALSLMCELHSCSLCLCVSLCV
jgi:hypothetical protein